MSHGLCEGCATPNVYEQAHQLGIAHLVVRSPVSFSTLFSRVNSKVQCLSLCVCMCTCTYISVRMHVLYVL